MQNRTHTLFQRLSKSYGKLPLDFDYMGKAEYEFGTAHAALNALVNDLGAPQVVTETQIVLQQKDFYGYDSLVKRGPRRGQSKKAHAQELAERAETTALLDGAPLRLRHIPALNDEDDADAVFSAKDIEAFNNAGGFCRDDTLAWLCIHPVVGILYHPSQEETVDLFLEKVKELRAEKTPDASERANAALKALRDKGIGSARVLRELRDGLDAGGPGL